MYDSDCLGRILVLDRVIQIGSKCFEDDQYTKCMVNTVVRPSKPYGHVVIIGGGDLVIATHLLREYPLISKVTVCEIDSRVVEVTKKYFSFADIVEQELAKGRLEVVIESGAVYMDKLFQSGHSGKIGAFIIDCTDFALDEDSLAAELFTPEFYS